MAQTNKELPELMTTDELAGYLGVKPQTLANWRSQGGGPKYTKIGGGVRYQKADVEKWLREQKK